MLGKESDKKSKLWKVEIAGKAHGLERSHPEEVCKQGHVIRGELQKSMRKRLVDRKVQKC